MGFWEDIRLFSIQKQSSYDPVAGTTVQCDVAVIKTTTLYILLALLVIHMFLFWRQVLIDFQGQPPADSIPIATAVPTSKSLL